MVIRTGWLNSLCLIVFFATRFQTGGSGGTSLIGEAWIPSPGAHVMSGTPVI